MNIVATQLQCSAGGGRVHKCTSYYCRVELLQNIVLLTILHCLAKNVTCLCAAAGASCGAAAAHYNYQVTHWGQS